MKKGWEYKKLGEIFPYVKNGANIKQSKGAGGIPITRIETLANGVFNYDRLGYADIIDAGKYEKNILSKGDILMSHINSLEHIGRAVAYKGDKKIIHGMNLLRLIPIESVNTDYCCFYFKTQNFKKAILSITHKSVNQASFNTSSLKSLSIPVPPLSEQKEIVEYLDSSFAKIDKLKENAAKNLEEAKALFQSALKDALEPKEGWEEKKLIKEFSLKSGDNLSTRKQIKGPFDVYGGNGVTGKHIEYNLSGKNILIGRVGALCGNIHFVNAKIWVTDNAFVVKNISEHWHMDFLTYELKYLNLNQYASQTAQPVISNKSMKDVMIMLPPLSEQQSIVSFLASLNEKVNTLQQNYSRICDECDALKQAILRQVFE